MKRIMPVALAVVLLATATLAEGAPRIVSITPPTGLSVGGDAVVIKLEDFSFACPICSPPFGPPRVLFGQTRAPDVSLGPGVSEVTAITPPRPPSSPLTVDVTVINEAMHESSVTASGAFTYVSEIERSKFEGLLIPIPIVPERSPLPGANGSRWASELLIRNGGKTDAVVFSGQEAFCLLAFCDPPVLNPTIKPTAFLSQFPHPVPSLLYVQKGQADLFAYSLRVRDLSRSTENEGTEIPVVREAELRFRPIHLLNVPINAQSRAALRLFETFAPQGVNPVANVTATLMLLPSISYTAQVQIPRHQSFGEWVTRPGYAAIDDLRTALGLPDSPAFGYDIEVDLLGSTGWAYVAVTNNQTQLVTAITPK